MYEREKITFIYYTTMTYVKKTAHVIVKFFLQILFYLICLQFISLVKLSVLKFFTYKFLKFQERSQ